MFVIESIARAHIPRIHLAIDAVSREGGVLGITQAPPITEFSRQMQVAIESGSPQCVATVGEEVVGWCMICRNEFPLFKHVGYLFMGILPHWRRRGIGTSLLQTSLGDAWGNQFQRIELEVLCMNDPAIALYRRFGFVTEGVKRQAYLSGEKYSDVLVMGLLKHRSAAGLAGHLT